MFPSWLITKQRTQGIGVGKSRSDLYCIPLHTGSRRISSLPSGLNSFGYNKLMTWRTGEGGVASGGGGERE